ncbi:hypothetical protein FRB93_009227 [Tulasnella sp. JGI-2019a]|nr:hypothetical protein FRB93_009227 [Tulasnella sp. JGI-2019a]
MAWTPTTTNRDARYPPRSQAVPMNSEEDQDVKLGTPPPSLARKSASSFVLAVFIVALLYLGLTNDYSTPNLQHEVAPEELLESSAVEDVTGHRKLPDFGQYTKLRTLTGEWLEKGDKRLILVGDIHGMAGSLEALLDKVDYTPPHDTLIHLGDIISKGPMSLEVLDRVARQNVTGVRGNHDQKVIEWRGYMEWVQKQKGGAEWFDSLVKMKLTPADYKSLSKSYKKFPIPKDWEWGGDHWTIAKTMSALEYDYLRNLPLAIHIPILHTFVVHAGILPIDPKKPIHEKHQPLSYPPTRHRQTNEAMRTAQELAIIYDIPQNEIPWTLLNMRSVTKRGKISRKSDVGVPWAEMWNEVQGLCGGFKARRQSDGDIPEQESEDLRKKKLPWYAIWSDLLYKAEEIIYVLRRPATQLQSFTDTLQPAAWTFSGGLKELIPLA